MEQIEYDHFGRMKYNKEFHSKNGTPWTYSDQQYLIQWYDKISPEEMSLALDRTSNTIAEQVNKLRKKGVMPKASCSKHERIGKNS